MGRKRRAAAAAHVCGLISVAACTAATGYEMRFWVESEAAARTAGVTSFEPHPCGAVSIVRTDRMPPYDPRAALIPEQVVEFDRGGQPVNRWSISVDSVLMAVRGDDLLVELAGKRYWVGRDGRIRRATYWGEPMDWREGQCGAIDPDAFCTAFVDLESGLMRNLSHRPVCT